MKKQSILIGLMAITSIVNAQWSISGINVYKTSSAGNVGIGTGSSPAFKLDINCASSFHDGIRVTQSTGYDASLFLNNTAFGSSKNWALKSYSSGDFAVENVTSADIPFYISGSNGNVGIGSASAISNRKLQVNTNISNSSAIYSYNTGAGSIISVAAHASSPTGVGGAAIGLRASAIGGQYNAAGYFEGYTSCIAGGNTYGIFAGMYGGACAGNYAGWFDGNVNINGAASCNSGSWTSDRKLKKDIKALTDGLEKIRLLKPSSYQFKIDEFKTMNLPEGNQLGLIAQELEEVYPELVVDLAESRTFDKEGNVKATIPAHKSVNYIGLIPVLISAVQEQDKTIQTQQRQIDELKQLVAASQAQATGIDQQNAETHMVMSQNEPNPFSNETLVNYNLPKNTGKANMVVYDLTGKQITQFELSSNEGKSITITSEKLAAGMYIYSIVADGKILDSKRMVVAGK